MNTEETLKKVMDKAMKNGWQGLELAPSDLTLHKMYFNHDFAKALWGNEKVDKYGNTFKEYKQKVKNGIRYPYNYEWTGSDLAWGYHLKNLAVTSENRIKYLSKFV